MIATLFLTMFQAHAILIPARSSPFFFRELVRDHALERGRLSVEDLETTRFTQGDFRKTGWRAWIFDDFSSPAVAVETEGRWPVVYVWFADGLREVEAREGSARFDVGGQTALRTKRGRWKYVRTPAACECYFTPMKDPGYLERLRARNSSGTSHPSVVAADDIG